MFVVINVKSYSREVYGPFDTEEEARAWAEPRFNLIALWEVARIVEPEGRKPKVNWIEIEDWAGNSYRIDGEWA